MERTVLPAGNHFRFPQKKRVHFAAVCATIKRMDTIEYSEERLIPNIDVVDIDAEKKLLWDVVNGEVDNQIADIYTLYNEEKNSRKKK